MEFEIKEYVGEFGPSKGIQDFFGNVLKFLILVILTPILLISKFFKSLFGQPDIEPKSKLDSYKEINGCKLQRQFIKEDELPNDLDYPEESNDVNFFKMHSNPNLPSLADKYFDYGDAETNCGLYLISINSTKNGMTLWCLNKKTLELIKVRDLPSLWWNMFEEEENVIRLRGDNGKTHYDIFINEKNCT